MHRSNRLAALTLAALVAVPAALTAEGHAPKLTGEWNLEFAAPWGMVVWTFDLEQEGTAINGTADPGMGTMVLEGTVTDHAIEFLLDLRDGPHAFSLEFTGTVSADGVTGSVTFEDGTSSEWTFTPVEVHDGPNPKDR
jgi:hypothetical protein